MRITRRDFLRCCLASAVALGLEASTIGLLKKALASGVDLPIIWLNASACTGCTVSLANLSVTSKGTGEHDHSLTTSAAVSGPADIADLLLNTIHLAYNTTLMGAAGELAVQTLHHHTAGKFILIVEGGIPTLFDGQTCILWSENAREVTALEAIRRLAPKAQHVISVGSCSSFGGYPGAEPNPTGIKSVEVVSGVKTINIAGCPPHPDWIVGVISQLLVGQMPALDAYGRPTAYFGANIHHNCPRKHNPWASSFGLQEDDCLNDLGCKGRQTNSTCPTLKWNGGTNWCVGAGGICIGCTSPGFPDNRSPLFSSIGATPPDMHPVVEERCTSCHASNPCAEAGMEVEVTH